MWFKSYQHYYYPQEVPYLDGTPTHFWYIYTKDTTQKENLFYQYHNSHTGLIAIFLHKEEHSKFAKFMLALSQWEALQKLWE